MKILFLDIDGVVNCKTTQQRHRGFIGIDPYMAFLVGKIVEDTGAKVVLSSSWRGWGESRDEVRKQVVDFVDITPTLVGKGRGAEIQSWLDKHLKPLEIAKYAILDDDTDMLKEQLPNFFRTKWETGLTDEIANQVTEYLNKNN